MEDILHVGSARFARLWRLVRPLGRRCFWRSAVVFSRGAQPLLARNVRAA